jgi:hypothetical protein
MNIKRRGAAAVASVSFSASIAVFASVAGVTGCHVVARPEPVTVTSGTYAPDDIESYPYANYEGRPVYLYNERWYYRDGGRWTYYRTPPPGLVRQRPYVRQAPPAQQGPRGYGPPGSGYRTPGASPPPASAPPATRVQ